MNKNFCNDIVLLLPEPDLVLRAMQERRDEILDAISEKRVDPTPALMIELSELNIQIGDAPEVGHG